MDRGVVHKSSAALVLEMGEAGHGHGWWSMNNLMKPPFEQQHHHPSLFMPSTTTTTTTGTAAAAVSSSSSSSSSSALHSFSSLLLSNHYPLPTTTSTSPPWQHDSSQHGQQDSWIHLIQGGFSCTSNKESQMGYPTTICSEAGGGSGGSYVVYDAAAASGHRSSTSDVEIQFPWGSSVLQQNKQQQQQKAASSPRSSSITTTTTTSLGSNMLEFSNNSSSSPRECISTASGSAFKKARTQEPSPAQSTVKVRKEKLGDRITALHQLVSPFGKTDTASVLLEAIGYIRFLHGQIEALSSPYVGGSNGGGGGSCSSSKHQHQLHEVHGERHSIFPEDPGQLLNDSAIKKRGLLADEQDESCEEAKKQDLRSRGLCLVPVSCTLDVGVDVVAGPADYWVAAPAFGMGFGG